MDSTIQIEETLFGEDRWLTVRYREPTDQWDSMEIKAVQMYSLVSWNEDGTPTSSPKVVDLLPVLSQFQLQEIEERVKALLVAESLAEAFP